MTHRARICAQMAHARERGCGGLAIACCLAKVAAERGASVKTAMCGRGRGSKTRHMAAGHIRRSRVCGSWRSTCTAVGGTRVVDSEIEAKGHLASRVGRLRRVALLLIAEGMYPRSGLDG